MAISRRRSAWGRTLRVGLFLFLCGCQADYYWHLARGQSRILFNCVSIEDLLARADLDSTRRENLTLIKNVRQFGSEQIGLQESSSYTRFYDTGEKPISWNVSASPPERFAPHMWSFPIAGSVPYKGFFSLKRAQSERARLEARGFDVLLRPVSAYSTLGYLPDPVLSTMLDYPVDALADLILHELTHGTVYSKGHTDFNESLATFIGQRGSLQFLAHNYGFDSPLIEQTRQRRRDAARFRDFMTGVVASLDSLYNRQLPRDEVLVRRREVFARAKERYQTLRPQFERVQYDGFLSWEVNNARLLSYRRYHYNLEIFDALYSSRGNRLNRVLSVCHSCADSPDPWVCLDDSLNATPATHSPRSSR